MKIRERQVLRRKAAALAAFVLAAACALVVAGPVPQAHADLAEELTVSVGYYGGPYYTKTSYTVSEMESMSNGVTYEYSTFDSAVWMRKGFGRGVLLTTLLQNAGVATPFYSFYFVTTDTGYADTYTWLYSDLIQTTRYYYPDYPYYYDFTAKGFLSGYAEALSLTAKEVPAILAIYSSFERIDGSYWQTQWNDSSGMNTNSGYRVMYGEYGPGQYDARGFAQNVTEVRCVYDGAPSITFDKSDVSGEVGETIILTPTIHADDSTIATQGIYDIVWSSSNESVATVTQNEDGTVSIQIWSTGEVVITAEFGNDANHKAVASVGGVGTIASEESSGDEEDDSDGEGSGSGEGTGSGDGTGSGTGSGDGAGLDEGSSTGGTGSDDGGWSLSELSGSGTQEGTSSLPEGAQLAYAADSETSTESIGSTEDEASSALEDEVGLGASAGEEGGGSAELLVQRLLLSSDALQVSVVTPWRYLALAGGLLAAGFAGRVFAYERSKDRFAKRKLRVWKHSAAA